MKVLITFFLLFSAALADPPHALPREALAAFKNGRKFILFSLEPPSARDFQGPKPKGPESHHGFKILGSTELHDPETRNAAFAAMADAVRAFDGTMMMCFEPRHSLRVITAKGNVYDFVACFECRNMAVFRGNKSIGTAGLTGSQARLDEILNAAGIPLPKASDTAK